MRAIVIGAGVIGLAAGRALARAGHEVIIAEAATAIGTVTSSRNSEVIHAGMYYPAGSVRAALCVEGRRALVEYCDAHGVAYALCGKLIVAVTGPEIAQIEAIQQRGTGNGVEELTLIDGERARVLEPNLACVAALLSPQTGVLDSHAYMIALQGDFEDAGGVVAFATPFLGAEPSSGVWQVRFGGQEPMTLPAEILVNAAGLSTWDVARAITGFPPAQIPARVFAKGNYFALAAKAPFRHLIYPAPVEGGLGTHMTLDLSGRAKFGPDVEWLGDADPAAIDYRVKPELAASFEIAIRRYWPALPDGGLVPDYAGVRPKLSAQGEPAADFLIQGPAVHGMLGLVNLFGIESPGLTASLAIADRVLDLGT